MPSIFLSQRVGALAFQVIFAITIVFKVVRGNANGITKIKNIMIRVGCKYIL